MNISAVRKMIKFERISLEGSQGTNTSHGKCLSEKSPLILNAQERAEKPCDLANKLFEWNQQGRIKTGV